MLSIKINGKEFNKHAVLPFKWSSYLDERLDEGRISLKGVPNKLFTPLTPVVIDCTISGKTTHERIDFVVSSDESSELPPGSGSYDHELVLIEPTKILERIVCDTLVFQNNLGRTYTAYQVEVEPVYE